MTRATLTVGGFFGGIALLVTATFLVALFPQMPAWLSAVIQVVSSLVGVFIGFLVDRIRREEAMATKARSGIRQLFAQVEKLSGVREQIAVLNERVSLAGKAADANAISQVLEVIEKEMRLIADSMLTDVANWDDVAPGSYATEMKAVEMRRSVLGNLQQTSTGEPEGADHG